MKPTAAMRVVKNIVLVTCSALVNKHEYIQDAAHKINLNIHAIPCSHHLNGHGIPTNSKFVDNSVRSVN